jgi:hypothetical protein
MNNNLIDSIIARLSTDERRIMALPNVQLATDVGDKGITIEKHHELTHATVKSLLARHLIKGKPDKRSGVMPLTMMGIAVNEQLVEKVAVGVAIGGDE